MECPICGETLPLCGSVCEACGNEYDGFFLTEEFASSSVRKSVAPQKLPRQPSALKPSARPPMDRKKAAMIGGAAVLVLLAGVALFAFIPRGHGAAGTAEEAVTRYYDYLRTGDAEGIFSLFEPGYLPVAADKAGIKAALTTNTYKASKPIIQVLSRTDNTSVVAIKAVEVDITSSTRGIVEKKSLAGYAQELPGGNPQMVSVVKLKNSGGGWRIAGRPVDGWAPSNIWLIGEVGNP